MPLPSHGIRSDGNPRGSVRSSPSPAQSWRTTTRRSRTMATSPNSLTQLTLFTPVGALTSSSAERPVSPSPSLACGWVWPTLEATSRWSFSDWSEHVLRAGSCGKTSPVSCRKTKDGRLEPSSEGWQTSGMGGPTGSLTLSTFAWTATLVPCPSDDAVSSLSDVLEETSRVPRRFYLSPRACTGILRRAESRGKKLPPMLLHALRFGMVET